MKCTITRLLSYITVLVFATNVANADAIFDVRVDTSSLTSQTVAVFNLFPDGSSGNNTATITSITFGGGSAGSGCPVVIQPCAQNATGDLTSSIVLNDSAGFSQFFEDFSPGSTLSFVLDLTTNAPTDPSSFPDAFGFTLFDSNGNLLPGADSSTGDYLAISIDSANPTIVSQVPGVTLSSAAVPEPDTLSLLAMGCIPLFSGMRRKLVRER
jgi:hypothetical protein